MNTTASPENASVEALLSQITDEFLQRLDAGEQPDIQEYVRRCPTLADVLRQVLPALSVLRQPPSGEEVPIAECEEAIRIKEDYAPAHYNLGSVTASTTLMPTRAAPSPSTAAWPARPLPRLR